MPFDLHIAATLGLLLAACLVAGLLAELIHVPKVTAYLLVGLFAGPSMLGMIDHDQVHKLEPLLRLALGLVLFQLGSCFPLPRVRRFLGRLIALSIGELVVTFVLVAVSVTLFSHDLKMGLMLAALALATAPATTILVLKDTSSAGPVTEFSEGLVTINNFATIVLFELVYLVLHISGGQAFSDSLTEAFQILKDVFGAMLIGGLMGFVISFACGLMSVSRWIVLLVAACAIVLGFCESLDMPYMLAFLMMGFVVVNSSSLGNQINSELDRFVGLLSVIFFVLHGTEMNLIALWNAGLIGGVYIVARTAGKYFGVRIAATLSNQPDSVRNWLGTALLAQAGAAIALSSIAAQRDPELGNQLKTIILGTVVFFELVGPIMIKQSVLRAGEVPVSQAIHHTSTTIWEQFLDVWNRLLSSLGLQTRKVQVVEESTVQKVMRSHVSPILESASFTEVLDHIEHSHDDTFPVVNDENQFVGLIRYNELSRELLDPAVNSLIRADDLAVPTKNILSPNQRITEVIELFRKTPLDCLPVVDMKAGGTLVGTVRRRDITNMVVKSIERKPAEENNTTVQQEP